MSWFVYLKAFLLHTTSSEGVCAVQFAELAKKPPEPVESQEGSVKVVETSIRC